MSVASTAIVIYVLKMLNELNELEERTYLNELLSFQMIDENHAGTFSASDDVTTWSTSQACLALESLGYVGKNLDDAIAWLCNIQSENGGWTFNGRNNSATRVEYCLYPLLVIKKYHKQNNNTKKALFFSHSYVETYKTTSTLEKAIRLFLLKNVYCDETSISEEHDVLRSLRKDILRGYNSKKIADSDEYRFYVDFYLPSYYLLLRAFTKPDNPLSLCLIKLLQDSIIEYKGWAPHGRITPYSWTTALSLLTIAFWISGCKKYRINDSEVIEKLYSIKKGDIAVQTYIERCPLNGGLCNKTDEINLEYSDDKIFIDIPYNPEYLTFEVELTKILKENGLNPIIAKDSIKSKALLCKICSLIQESKYGLADVSYSTQNIPFELGLLMGLSKNCVILKKKDASIPSDIDGLEYVEYQNTIELKSKLLQWIKDNK